MEINKKVKSNKIKINKIMIKILELIKNQKKSKKVIKNL